MTSFIIESWVVALFVLFVFFGIVICCWLLLRFIVILDKVEKKVVKLVNKYSNEKP